MKKILFLFVVLTLCLAGTVDAHQPRLVFGGNVVDIKNPEISQAFYSELKGEPAYYQIKSDDYFDFYANLLVPNIKEIKTDVSAEVTDENGAIIFFLDGPEQKEWKSFYEPFAGDSYLKGPEAKVPEGEKMLPGNYQIKVFSSNNNSKYVLVVGEKESFPITEIINMVKVLPILKSDFFGKPPLFAFFNLTGLVLLVPFVVLFGLAMVAILKIKKQKRKKVV
ncbi:MAG: hypothetical protein COU29_00605 [Candidatus Magasanikbacteria bacterium CG10_big_fil_rev_8_21_14_0_10_36_32]|uniref:Uncharacterized protein n=1 Tax=Candidatus Magasanikbacteria bacterium CG10_big_fil_rev_8_21_14_0_10_36_32 TaxID=1974646 RepID=A0A2M6W7K1_9BACT|nr:MAG: hypothetical protein COU29_00605 [Candidatus Magasanikbacteria bacterium CG10_big_fil_rev_8_21_14_0_10_36_32]